jgi:hypothetical protein
MGRIRAWRYVAKIFLSIVALSTVAAGFLFATHRMGTTFDSFDDEGYVLLSLSRYFAGERLYNQVFTQYGPFYFQAQAAIFRLFHLPLTHDAGRIVTLAYCCVAELLAGWLITKISRNILFGGVAISACFVLCNGMAGEANHPQQLVFLGLILASAVSLSWSDLNPAPSALVLGGIGAALLFTKINVGIFYLVALTQALACILPRGRIRRIMLVFTFFYAAFAPFFLMRAHFFEWAYRYCLIAIVSGLAVFIVGAFRCPEDPRTPDGIRYSLLGFLATATLIVITSLIAGISPRTLLQGVVIDPLKQPALFTIPWEVERSTLISAKLITFLLIALHLLGSRLKAVARWVWVAQCLVGVGAIFLLIGPVPFDLRPRLMYVLPCLPLSLVRLPGAAIARANSFSRLFITSLAATQFLQAYPVAGTQVNIAAAPILLWAFIVISDGCDELPFFEKRAVRKPFGIWSRPVVLTSLAVAIALALTIGLRASGALSLKYVHPSSTLKGSALMHLPPQETATYQFLAESISANCEVLFGMPVMGSFNLWSGVKPPNGQNFGPWMKPNALDLPRQQEILGILRGNRKACVIYNQSVVEFWGVSKDEALASPLARFILYEMRTTAEREGYEIKVHPARVQPWISVSSGARSNNSPVWAVAPWATSFSPASKGSTSLFSQVMTLVGPARQTDWKCPSRLLKNSFRVSETRQLVS